MTHPFAAAFDPRPMRPLVERPPAPRPFRSPDQGRPARGPVAAIRLWLRRIAERHALRRLAEGQACHLLRDVGLTRAELLREAEKPFWRA